MTAPGRESRPRLALPFTVLTSPGRVRLVCGEDLRYSLAAPGVEAWLPALLALLDGRRTLDEALASVPADRRESARELVQRLAGERVLVEGPASDAHRPARAGLAPGGRGPVLAELSAAARGEAASPALAVLVQDRLDWGEALDWNRRRLEGREPYLWVSHGALARGYVGPVHLPGYGPCLECLVRGFERLSPEPAIYGELVAHARSGGAIEPATFPAAGVAILAQLVRWKAALLEADPAPAALYRLHVLEAASLETSSHRVHRDPGCPACGP